MSISENSDADNLNSATLESFTLLYSQFDGKDEAPVIKALQDLHDVAHHNLYGKKLSDAEALARDVKFVNGRDNIKKVTLEYLNKKICPESSHGDADIEAVKVDIKNCIARTLLPTLPNATVPDSGATMPAETVQNESETVHVENKPMSIQKFKKQMQKHQVDLKNRISNLRKDKTANHDVLINQATELLDKINVGLHNINMVQKVSEKMPKIKETNRMETYYAHRLAVMTAFLAGMISPVAGALVFAAIGVLVPAILAAIPYVLVGLLIVLLGAGLAASPSYGYGYNGSGTVLGKIFGSIAANPPGAQMMAAVTSPLAVTITASIGAILGAAVAPVAAYYSYKYTLRWANAQENFASEIGKLCEKFALENTDKQDKKVFYSPLYSAEKKVASSKEEITEDSKLKPNPT